MDFYLYALPFVDALLLGVIVKAGAGFLIKRCIEEQPLCEVLKSKLKQADLAAVAEPLVDKRIDAFILMLKEQIPLASMLLSSNLVTKLKGQGKAEILKMVPEVRRILVEKIEEERALEIAPFLEPLIRKAIWYAVGIGFLLGLLHLIVMKFVCQ